MSARLLLRWLIASGALCTAQAAFADCGSSKEKGVQFQDDSVLVKFIPTPRGQVAVGASITRANEVAPYIRIRLGPDLAELKNEPFNSEGGSIYYLENGSRGQRICRAEEWRRRESKLISEAPPEGLHPAVRRVYPFFELYKRYDLDYDASGQLTSIQQVDAAGHRVTTFCALYDDRGRVKVASETSGLVVSEDPDFLCPQLDEKSPKSVTWYFTYGPDGSLASSMSREPTREASEQNRWEDAGVITKATDGAWFVNGDVKVIKSDNERAVGVTAFFAGSEKKGLKGIRDFSFAIVPDDVTALFAERSQDGQQEMFYRFPGERVPIDLATGLFEGITDYTRVREYRHRSHSRIFEVFSPGAKHPRERQWRTLDLNRQENYDANGKLTRVILSGPVPADGYTENLRAYAEKGVLKLTPLTNGYSSYRVYDYDATGKETLSFVCWRYEVSTNKPYAHFPWWEPDPRPKRSREAELQYGRTQVGTRCGTPDGKMIVEGMGPVKKLMETKYGFGTTKLGLPGE